MTTDWNYADVFETVVDTVPDQIAQIQGDRRYNWRELDRRANALAAHFLQAGLQQQSKVAAYLHNCPEYLETYFAAFKVSLVPINTNYRYSSKELHYLWDNADTEAVIFHAAYAPVIDEIRSALKKVKYFYAVADGAPIPDWAEDYEAIVGTGTDRIEAPWKRTGDDLLLLYTGGTTGMPKGVMWRVDDLFNVLGGGGNAVLGLPPVADYQALRERILTLPPELRSAQIPACPLMHGTGQFGSFIGMAWGRAVVCLPERKFDSASVWQQTETHRVGSISIVGDAFAKPMLKVLDDAPGQYDLSSLRTISSSGVMWSQANKEGLIRHLPQVTLIDAFGSSEAVGLGVALTNKEMSTKTADFQRPETLKVFTEEGREVQAGDGQTGRVSLSGFLPLGYYKDQKKTEETFITVQGVRYSVPGDFARINADGTLQLLGRGSVCINTGGEKVFPEEVEEVLKQQQTIADAVCVGVPDERFGQAICAIVEPECLAQPPELASLSQAMRADLAAYKVPRYLIIVESIGRAPNGKVDYKKHTEAAMRELNFGAA